MRIQELGHVVLYITNLQRSVAFYRDVLGFPEVARARGMAVFSSGRTHHEMLLIEIGGTPTLRHTPKPGLYHIGFKIGDKPEDIHKAFHELTQHDVPVIGATDHGVTHSLYILDPDGNELELYVDVSDAWKTDPTAILSAPRPLQLP